MIYKVWKKISSFASGEFMLKRSKANGGSIILGRAIFVSTWLTLLVIITKLYIKQSWSIECFFQAFIDIADWSAGFFGAVYIALYARFSSQWTYMAGLYNQIKQAELSAISINIGSEKSKELIAQWKAAYIEDAYYLHLYGKKSVAIVIYHWADDPKVKSEFIVGSINGTGLWEKIHGTAIEAVANAH